MSGRVLVAGVGNVFLGDDGFGPEVARRMAGEELPVGVTVTDFGIRGVHLAFELLDPPDLLLVVDATARGQPPGTLVVLEPELDELPPGGDAHGMDVVAVLGQVRGMGGVLPKVLVVGCEPATVDEGLGLSPEVEAAVAPAIELVRTLVEVDRWTAS